MLTTSAQVSHVCWFFSLTLKGLPITSSKLLRLSTLTYLQVQWLCSWRSLSSHYSPGHEPSGPHPASLVPYPTGMPPDPRPPLPLLSRWRQEGPVQGHLASPAHLPGTRGQDDPRQAQSRTPCHSCFLMCGDCMVYVSILLLLTNVFLH